MPSKHGATESCMAFLENSDNKLAGLEPAGVLLLEKTHLDGWRNGCQYTLDAMDKAATGQVPRSEIDRMTKEVDNGT